MNEKIMKGERNLQLNYNECVSDKRRRITRVKTYYSFSHELSKLSTIVLTFRKFELSPRILESLSTFENYYENILLQLIGSNLF